MEYPHPSLIESRLKQLAIELGDATVQPFRVDLVRVHGGKPPVYSVVIRASAKELLRNRLEQLLNRKLTCGISSFMLQSHEAERLLRAGPLDRTGVGGIRCQGDRLTIHDRVATKLVRVQDRDHAIGDGRTKRTRGAIARRATVLMAFRTERQNKKERDA